MADYRKPYFALFNAITEALMYLELGAYEDVRIFWWRLSRLEKNWSSPNPMRRMRDQ